MYRTLIAPLALLVASCGDPGAHQTPEEALMMEAQEAVRAELKDPESARFGETAATIVLPSIGAVCFGTVNAKNSFGGYAGEQKFFYRRGQGVILLERGGDGWQSVNDACLAELKRITREG